MGVTNVTISDFRVVGSQVKAGGKDATHMRVKEVQEPYNSTTQNPEPLNPSIQACAAVPAL